MGQEASVPVGEEGQDSNNNNNGNSDAAFSLEEQAKAPPSAVHPPSSTTSGLSPQKDTSKRKLALPNILFHRSGGGNAKEQQQQQPQHHHHQAPQHSHDVESFEYREAARAAAAGGNLYHQSSSDESLTHSYTNNNNSDDHYALHRMPVSHQPGALPIHDYNNNTNDIYSASTTVSKSPPLNYSVNGRGDAGDAGLLQHRPIEGNPPATATYGTNNNINNSNSNSLTGETSGSAKKGLFSTRGAASARGMINSMRNLSLGGALRKQKEVNDWEKQWDEDEDDSDDGEGGVDTTGVAASAGQHGENSSALINGSSSLPPLVDGHLPPYLTNDAGMPMPKSPTRPPDLLDLPSAYPPASTSPQRQQYQRDHLQQTGLETWDTADLPQDQYALDVRKPDVEMFLPVLRVLGKGSFGKVVLVQKREGKERGQLFAMKVLKKTHLVKRRQIERTRTERKVLSVVNHPFIMKLHYAFQTPEKLYLILDYCPGGELFFHLSRFRRFPERVARFYAAELLLAIGHLHKRGIIYRDLKPENVLLDAEGHVKLGDFGLAKAGIQHPYEGATSMCGTPEYMAPEVLAQQGHGFCVDYWGLGMIVYEMMTGLPPWYTTDRAQLFRRLKSAPLDIPQFFSESSADCVAALLERNPRRRLGVTGIRTAMEHDFFRNISWRALYSRRVEAPVRPCEGWKPPDAVGQDSDLFAQNGSFAQDSSQFYPDGVAKLDSTTLDNATQNFDAQFTRMPVESEDNPGHDPVGDEFLEDLNENTFLGFSFDIIQEKEKIAIANGVDAAEQGANPSSRDRTQNFHPTLDHQEQL